MQLSVLAVAGAVVGALLLCVAFFLVNIYRTSQRNQRKFGHIAGQQPHWLLGNIGQLPKQGGGYRFVEALAAKFNATTILLWYGPQPLVIVSDPENIRHLLLTKQAPKLGYDNIRDLVGNGLVTSNGEHWHRMRRLFNPGFHVDFLKRLTPVMVDRIALMLDRFEHDVTQGKTVSVHEEMIDLTLDIIGLIAFNHDFQFVSGKVEKELRESLALVLSESGHRGLNPFHQYMHPFRTMRYTKALKVFKNACQEIIKKNRDAVLNNKGDDKLAGKSIVSLLLSVSDESGDNAITDENLMDEVGTFLFAGHETTAATLSFALLLLCKHPEVKAKAEEEVMRVMDGSSTVTYEQQASMRYLNCIMKEALRLYPIGPGTARTNEEDEILPDGTFLPAGSKILASFYQLHRNPKVWPEPSKFRPERFEASADGERQATSGWMPFSSGQRNCIGQPFAYIEIKAMLAMFLYRFDFELIDKHVEPEDFLVSVTIRPPPYRLRLIPRKH